jgi:hypothetical protein
MCHKRIQGGAQAPIQDTNPKKEVELLKTEIYNFEK